MAWNIQLCIKECADVTRRLIIGVAVGYIKLCMFADKFVKWCKRTWYDRNHILARLQLYLFAFLLIKTEVPTNEVLWASVIMVKRTRYSMISHTREFTDPIRAFYEISDAHTGAALCRWSLSYEPEATCVQIVSRIGKCIKISSLDITNDREIITGLDLPVDESDMPCVKLCSLPGVEVQMRDIIN